jgi:hypothetical protein
MCSPKTAGSSFGYPDAIVRVFLRHVKAQIRLIAEKQPQITDNIRVLDRSDHIVSGLHLIYGLIKFENIHRPGKVLNVNMKMPGHDAEFTRFLYSDSSDPVLGTNRTTKSMPVIALIEGYDILLLFFKISLC